MEQEKTGRNPDVLECLANLSNDEVFTPPRVANAMLDLLPQELFRNPQTTFLDPCCKSGVFLREIAKRLIVGLEPVFPDLQERLDHIFQKQLFGFAITELTAHTSRRTVYCSKFADGRYALSRFDAPEGNIPLPPAAHAWKGGRCTLCGASAEVFGKRAESHTYAFIHGVNPERLFDMKFDVVIGNPPYQLADAGESTGASPIYHYFVEKAKQLLPEHMVMIIPSRWFAGGKGLGDFREKMLQDHHMKVLHDFLDAKVCFGNGVEIKGGVCYFHWEKSHTGPCHIVTHPDAKTTEVSDRYLLEPGVDTFIRHHLGVSIYNKVKALGEPNSCCSETYIVIGAYKEKETAEHVASYIRTRFFRFLVLMLKNTQDAPRRVYRLVPLQDFSRPWTDAELYAKYGLTDEEIAFIESMVKPMEV